MHLWEPERFHEGSRSTRPLWRLPDTTLLVLLSNDDNHHLHRLSSSLIAHFPLVLAALIGHFPASGLCCSARKPLIRGSPSHDRTGQPRWGAQRPPAQSLQVAVGERPFNSLRNTFTSQQTSTVLFCVKCYRGQLRPPYLRDGGVPAMFVPEALPLNPSLT